MQSILEKSARRELLAELDRFAPRHIGPDSADIDTMLATLGVDSVEQLIAQTIPASIRTSRPLDLPEPLTESAALRDLRTLADQNQLWRTFIGMGYSNTYTPTVILRNILENPGWYTQYTPYQPEIAQGRLEALLNYQTMVMELTGMEIANASLLDEATAAAEAMTLAFRAQENEEEAKTFFISELCHPQTIHLVATRAEALGIQVVVGDHASYRFDEATFGALIQYPATNGDILDYSELVEQAHQHNALVIVASDLLALTLLTPPAEWGADVVVGSSQRFGVPMGYGGPHAAFFATRESYKRLMPGRLVGISKDAQGNRALRLALQTREQHIRRDRATSNICTAQVLLAIVASMYAVYHGPEGLKRIAQRVRLLTQILADGLAQLGYEVNQHPVFDTITVKGGRFTSAELLARAETILVNLRYNSDGSVGISLDETTNVDDLYTLFALFGDDGTINVEKSADQLVEDTRFGRTSPYLTQAVFNRYHSETELLRYITRLESYDLSLAYAMIPLGSCTMKLNATTEMEPITWPHFSQLHPFVPQEQAKGYRLLFDRLEAWLAEITGFSAVSLQPNAGSQGEYAGLLAIRAYHHARGDAHRDICLIPSSAHGTNPASAAMAGMHVVVVDCDQQGNIDLADLRAKAEKHQTRLAAAMVTYPSTHGVFEESIIELCQIVHQYGGQLYLDGANMNALVGLVRPAELGADVCHLNLHKTFCIPHGGGGPGMGPICVAAHLAPYLPNHIVVPTGGEHALGSISAAPWGSSSILPIPYAYIAMMGGEGLTNASRVAILSANYIATRLAPHYPILYKGKEGRIAHECIIDVRGLKDSAGITPDDIAKRLIDYGFHAPTMSWPVAGTLMIEPTESESLAELDRFCDAMIAIRQEIAVIERGEIDAYRNPLKYAPHTASVATAEQWDRPYSRQQAAFPSQWVQRGKLWPIVGRIDNVYGDRNLVCACEPLENYR